MFEELDVVELTHDIKEDNLKKGSTGTIVEIYKGGKAYEVEFIAPDGSTSILLTLMPDDIRAYVNKGRYLYGGVNAPTYDSNVTTMAPAVTEDNILRDFDIIIKVDEFNTKSEKRKSTAEIEKFSYFSPTL